MGTRLDGEEIGYQREEKAGFLGVDLGDDPVRGVEEMAEVLERVVGGEVCFGRYQNEGLWERGWWRGLGGHGYVNI